MSTPNSAKTASHETFFAEGSLRASTVFLAGFWSGGGKSYADVAPLVKRLEDSGVSVIGLGSEMPDRLSILSAIIDAGGLSVRSARLAKLFEEPTVLRAQHTIVFFDKVSDRDFSRALPTWLTKWPEAVFARSHSEVVTLVLQYWIHAGKERPVPTIDSEPKSIGSLPRMLELGEVLRDPKSHELDAKRVAKLFDLQHAEVARWAKISPQALDQRPTGEALLPVLRLLERVGRLRIMRQVDEKKLRQWFRTPLPRLEQRTPFELFQDGAGDRVANLVDNLVTGQLS